MQPILRELRALERAGWIALDPRSLLDVVRILEMAGEDAEALAHGLASRLTHEPDHREHVLAAIRAAQARAAAPTSTPPPPPPRPPRSFLAQAFGWPHVVLIGLALAGGWIESVGDAPVVMQSAGSAVLPPPTHTSVVRMEAQQQRAKVEAAATPAEEVLPGPSQTRWGLIGGACVLAVLAAIWGAAPQVYRRRRSDALTRARETREAWRADGVHARTTATTVYPPFEPRAIDDAATILGRLLGQEVGEVLDVPASIRATIDAGGMLSPVYAGTTRREVIVVLVDRADAPHLAGVEWTLDRWRRLGLTFVRHDYEHTPTTVMSPNGPVRLETVAARTAGAPLMIFSRMRGAEEAGGEVPFLKTLEAWPSRVWIDLDPRGEEELEREDRRLRWRLVRSGLRRFVFEEEGLIAAARSLTIGEGVARRAEVVTGSTGAEAQIELWAATTACAPDLRWSQVEGLRRAFAGFSEIAEPPLAAGDVERLIAWLRSRGYVAETAGEGPRLHLSAAGRRALLARLRAIDAARAGGDREGGFEGRTRRFLIAELRAVETEDPYELALRELKIAVHEAILEPARAGSLLPRFAGSGVAYELRELLAEELPRVDVGWSRRDRRAIAAFVEAKDAAQLGDLWRWPGGRTPLIVAVYVVAFVAYSWRTWWVKPRTPAPPQAAEMLTIPATWKVVATSPEVPPIVEPDPPPAGDDGTTGDGASSTGATGDDEVTTRATDLRKDPSGLSFEDLMTVGCVQAQTGDARQGLELLLMAYDLRPNDVPLLECLGQANVRLGRYEDARDNYLRILKVSPRSKRALLGAAQASESLNRVADAALYYAKLRDLDPTNASARAFFRANPELDTRTGIPPAADEPSK